MYGLVNRAVEEMVRKAHGDAMWEKIRRRAGVDVDVFVTGEAYDDDVTYRLVGAASETLGLPAEQVLAAFGEHWVKHTAPSSEVYGSLMEITGSNLADFLENLPELHSRVMLTMPALRPPEFWVTERQEGSLLLHYRSVRQGLQPFVVGLLRGLGEHFALELEVECLPRPAGQDHEQFRVRYRPRGEGRA